MMSAEFDDTLGIVRCISRGTTSFEDVEAFGRKAMALQTRSRARHGGSRLLVDASETAVPTQQAAAHFSQLASAEFQSGDRTAIIIQSAIAKLQSQRMTARDATAYFTDEAEALAWLLADPA